MNRLNRKVTEDDLRDKGFPFECDNCGNKPTPQDVIAHEGSCNLCGDSIIAFTVDTAAFIQDLHTKLAQAEADLAKFDNLARRYHNGYDPQMRKDLGMKEPESPLQALEEVLDEKHDIDTAGWEAKLTQAQALLTTLVEGVEKIAEQLGDFSAETPHEVVRYTLAKRLRDLVAGEEQNDTR